VQCSTTVSSYVTSLQLRYQLAELASREKPSLKMGKIDIDQNPMVAARFLIARLAHVGTSSETVNC
jgi:thioredoxin-like negative regulator of GroEL